MKSGDVVRRLIALENIIRPSDGLAGRIEALSQHDREIYDTWSHLYQRWLSRFTEPDGAYCALLDGWCPPQLPTRINEKLHDCIPKIAVTDTLETIQQKYYHHAERRK